MRKPSEYLPSALAGLRGRLMPDCSETLCHGGRSATVTRVGSPSRGEASLSGGDILEEMRILASASDFPALTKGNIVTLSGVSRLVSRVTSDPAGATLSVWLSPETTPVAFHGDRPNTRKVALTVRCGIVEQDAALTGEYAPSSGRTFNVYVSRAEWREAAPPEIGEWARTVLPGDTTPTWLKVSSVSRLATGDFRLSLVCDPNENGGPSWLR